MILTCPACATRYFVEDAKLGPQGKTVRCASCSNKWLAVPETEEPVELLAALEDPMIEDLAAESEPPAEDISKAFRARVVEKKTVRSAVINGAVWAGMAATLGGILALSVLFRVDVVRFAPRSASAYAAVGLPVNPTGLVFEGVAAHPSLHDGHTALLVSGTIRNVEDRSVLAPPLKIAVLDRAGKAVAHKLASASETRIAPGESRHFVVAVLDPPTAASNVDVSFMLDHVRKATAKAPAKPAAKADHAPSHDAAPAHGPATEEHGHEVKEAQGPALSLRGAAAPSPPEPVRVIQATDAKPLDPNSPYALPGRQKG